MKAAILLVALALAPVVQAYSCSSGSSSGVCGALKDIYDNTGGTGWFARCGWCNIFSGGSCGGDCTSGGSWADPCGSSDITRRWDGVECFSNGDIKSLNLGFNSLSGSLPDISGLGTTLERAFFQDNSLSNTNLAAANIHQLTGLVTLTLQNNAISGAIPANILGMENLENLYLFNNDFDQALPASITCAAGAGNCGLKTLRFNDNDIPGAFPAAMGVLTNLVGLYGHNNEMTGALPDIFDGFSELLFVDLYNNNFVGPLPADLNGGSGPNFDLSSNPLDCLLPPAVTTWAHLVDLTGNAGFFCNTATSVVIPDNVNGVGTCVPISLTDVVPPRIDSSETTTQVTITGTGFNRCTSEWIVKMSGASDPAIISVTSPGGTDTLVVTLTNPDPGGVSTDRAIHLESGGVSISTSISVNYFKTCDAQCDPGINPDIAGCDQATGLCQCKPGFSPDGAVGPYCTTETCPVACNNGYCEDQVCVCNAGWQGAICAEPYYPCDDPTCCGNGVCDTTFDSGGGVGRCACTQRDGFHQWQQPDCCNVDCLNDCSGVGTCDTSTGTCTCPSDRAGTDCSVVRLDCTPADCWAPFGDCDIATGECRCVEGHGGAVPYETCNECRVGFEKKDGEDECLRTYPCQATCTAGRGTCDKFSGICICDSDEFGPLFQGSQCEFPKCPDDCTNQGTCVQCTEDDCIRPNVCECATGFTGDNCAKKVPAKSDEAALAGALTAVCVIGAAAGALYALRKKKIADIKKKNQEMK